MLGQLVAKFPSQHWILALFNLWQALATQLAHEKADLNRQIQHQRNELAIATAALDDRSRFVHWY